MIEIRLPWPDPKLMPNRKNGRHWGGTQEAKVKARNDGRNAALAAIGRDKPELSDRTQLRITFGAPDRRNRDIDNLLASMKPFLDGIAKALNVDDRIFRPLLVDSCIDPKKQGYVIVEIGNDDTSVGR